MTDPFSFTMTGFNGTLDAAVTAPPIDLSGISNVRTLRNVRVRERRTRNIREATTFDWNWIPQFAEYLNDFKRGWIPPVGHLTDRRAGSNWPFYRTELELNLLRSGSRILAGLNQHAGGMVGGLSAYIVGTGMLAKCTPSDGTKDPGDKQLCKLTQSVIDEFYERELFEEYQILSFQESLVDGITIPRLFNQEGYAELRNVQPEQLRQPPGSDYREYSFGIRTPPSDRQKFIACWLKSTDEPMVGEEVLIGGTREAMDAHDVCFPTNGFAPNPRLFRGLKVGCPLFSYGTREAINAVEKLVNNMGIGSAIRQAFSHGREHEKSTQAAVQGMVEDMAAYETTDVFDSSRTRTTEVIEPGTVFDMPAGMKFVNPPTNPETQYAIAVADVLYRSAGALWGVPEWMLSGNAANMGAYTSSLVAESPAVKRWQQAQSYYKRRFLKILQTVVRFAVMAGRLPEAVLHRVTITLTAPTIETRDKEKEAATNNLYIGAGVKSRQFVAEELGLDFERMLNDNKEFQKMTAPPPAPPAEKDAEPAPGETQDLPLPGATQGEPEDGDLDPFGDVTESLRESVAGRVQVGSLTMRIDGTADGPEFRRLTEAGFTGTVTDTLGRERRYVDGRQVASHPADPAKQPGVSRPGTPEPPSLPAKLKAAAVKAVGKISEFAATLGPAAPLILENADEFARNAIMRAGSLDIGVGPHAAAQVVSWILSKVVTGLTEEESTDQPGDVDQEQVKAVLAILSEHLGIPINLEESGEPPFTGVKTYSNGAKHYYQDGKHVKNPSPEEKERIEKENTSSEKTMGFSKPMRSNGRIQVFPVHPDDQPGQGIWNTAPFFIEETGKGTGRFAVIKRGEFDDKGNIEHSTVQHDLSLADAKTLVSKEMTPDAEAGEKAEPEQHTAHSVASSVRALYDKAGDISIPYETVTATLDTLEELGKADLLHVAEKMELAGMASKSAKAVREQIRLKVLNRRSAAQRADMIKNPKGGTDGASGASGAGGAEPGPTDGSQPEGKDS